MLVALSQPLMAVNVNGERIDAGSSSIYSLTLDAIVGGAGSVVQVPGLVGVLLLASFYSALLLFLLPGLDVAPPWAASAAAAASGLFVVLALPAVGGLEEASFLEGSIGLVDVGLGPAIYAAGGAFASYGAYEALSRFLGLGE